jgi:6-pyruvoyltetrahydropterin/6-carboxytetrahydropterin synthase
MILIREFKFDAAHNLVEYHGKCEKLHGHTYKLVVKLEGTPGKEDMIMDFAELKKIVESNVLQHLDHAYINNLIKQPSAENIAKWVWEKLYDKFQQEESCRLYEIEIWETQSCGVSYRGE